MKYNLRKGIQPCQNKTKKTRESLRVRDHPGPWQQQLRGGKTRRQRAHVTAVCEGIRKGVTGKRRPLRAAGGEDRCIRRGEEI